MQARPEHSRGEIKAQEETTLAAAVMLLAIAVVAPGSIPAVFAIAILIAGLAGSTTLWRSADIPAAPFTKQRQEALRSFNAASARWQTVQHAPLAFTEAKNLLQVQRRELDSLPALKGGAHQ